MGYSWGMIGKWDMYMIFFYLGWTIWKLGLLSKDRLQAWRLGNQIWDSNNQHIPVWVEPSNHGPIQHAWRFSINPPTFSHFSNNKGPTKTIGGSHKKKVFRGKLMMNCKISRYPIFTGTNEGPWSTDSKGQAKVQPHAKCKQDMGPLPKTPQREVLGIPKRWMMGF